MRDQPDDPAPSLDALEDRGGFARRHIGPDDAEAARMLAALGLPDLDALLAETIPPDIRLDRPLALPPPRDEAAAMAALAAMAAENVVAAQMIGAGFHGTVTPPVIRRNLFENPGWYTAYTPYQPEISQGRLELLLTFQQAVMDLTGLPLANASLLDEPTAAAEAMAMARRVSPSAATAFFVDADAHPQTLAVLRTRAEPLGVALIVGERDALEPAAVFGALLCYPGASGAVRDWRGAIGALRAAGAVSIVATDLLALALLAPPGELGADVAVGSAQRFGVPMGFGGPHAAFLAATEPFKRQLPGRIIGVSVDAEGRPAFRMALQTREQHIRRDRATSNICTAQALLAMMAAGFAAWHGPEGVARIARRAARFAAILAEGLRRLGFAIETPAFFDTITVRAPGRADAILARARASGVLLRRADPDRLALACDETTTRAIVETVWRAFAPDAPRPDAAPSVGALDEVVDLAIPPDLARWTPFLTHPVFRAHRSETAMMRWLRRLREKDLALDRAMIPLGSCTMKLNAAAEMAAVSLPGFADLHPLAPPEHARGYARLFADLEAWLGEITGLPAVSLQPNAGSQGEYAGLLAIRRWHARRGEARDMCLIPASAHGTNPASAAMAGLKVVVLACDARGDVDLGDLDAKLAAHGPRVAALMLTYPSTHGVFEAGVRAVCARVHAAGGQVYMDGANLNAMVGLARPGDIGADVCHINLHKTFCIPHGGGGPGMGPIAAAAHLAPFLPGDPIGGEGAVSGAAHGSASILPISWAYIAMMGPEGLRRASAVAILNANYVAARLAPHYPVLFAGERGRVAHEVVLDCRGFRAAGVTVEDVAKRLIDYGFHAPTMSWPIPDALMVEPTESEPLSELDRFCDAMIAIRAEIAAVAEGRWPRRDNPLANAPHTLAAVAAESWSRPYSRETAAFPSAAARADKFWPAVARVDNAFGDRTLVCGCPPPSAWEDAPAP